MQVNFNYFNMPEDPQLFICNANNYRLATIARYADSTGTNTLNITMNYNRTSELTIQVYKFLEDTFHREALSPSGVAQCYQYIANYRQIHVEGLGYFIITEAKECDDGYDPYWDITATSCEIEINSKGIVLPAGTYQFWDADNPSDTILGKILNLCPNWSVGTVSSSVAALSRTFDELSQTVYNFMMNDMANAYSCVCDFDIENRKINIIDMESEIPSTDILLTYDNVLNDVKVDQTAENILTALNVSGGSDSVDGSFDITSVNPIGGNVIYNFSYFMNTVDMDQSLIDAINAWQSKVSNNQSAFSDLVLQIQNAESTLETLDGELTDLQTDLSSLNQELSVCLADPDRTNYSTIKSNIDAKQTTINSKQTEVNNQTAQINALNTQLSTLQSSLTIQNNFTTEQYKQLTSFIHQSDFKDENIVTTNSMTYATKQAQAQELYDKAELLLSQRCQPTSTIEIECLNFILMPEFDKFRDQIELGKMIHVELNPDNIIDMMLLQYKINYDTKELTIGVSNRLKLHDNIKDVQDWETQLAASANTLSLNSQKWSYPSGVITNIEDFVASPIDLTKNGIVQASNQKMLIDDTGYHGFQYDSSSQTYDATQCWMTNFGLYFTTDSWNTVQCGLGKIKLPDGTTTYGFNGDAIVAGKIISPTNSYVYFDLTNGILASSKLVGATEGATDVYANIGVVTWSEGQTSKGMGLYSEDGTICYFDQAEEDALGKIGLEIASTGKLRLRSSTAISEDDNTFAMYNDTDNHGHIEMWRARGINDDELVFTAYDSHTEIYARSFINLYTNTGNMNLYIASDGFHFGAGGYERAMIDSMGYHGWINGHGGVDGDITDKDGNVWHFEGGILVG